MKKLHQILLLAMSFAAWSVGAAAQERIVEIVKDGQVVFSIPASEIEYMTVVDPLPVPKNVRGVEDNGKVTVTWDAVDGATSYKVFRSADGNNFSLLGTSPSTSFTDNSPMSGSNYYCVRAWGANGVSSEMSAATQLVIKNVQGEAGIYNGHEYVDLGLPSGIKWATCNVGASSPSDYGDCFAWGETTTKDFYSEGNCKTWEKELDDISGNPQYDAARANWGGSWRLPSKAECEELVNKCTWIWTRQGYHNGYEVTGPNGKSIFLPLVGFYYGSLRDKEWEHGFYWSSTPYEHNTQDAYALYFGSDHIRVNWWYHFYGLAVRPVSE